MHGADDVKKEELRALLAASRVTEAAGRLHRAHQEDVRRFVASRVARSEQIDDICGEVWMSVVGALGRYRGAAAPLTWLFEIARYKIADLMRRSAGRTMGSLDGAIASVTAPSSTRASRRIEREESRRAVRRIVSRLSPAEQELLELRYVHGLTPAQIVEQQGSSERPNTVSKRLSLLRHRLREMAAEESALT